MATTEKTMAKSDNSSGTSGELLTCYNFGCGQKFKAEDNTDKSCVYHPGSAVFHDALKGWSCCKKRVTDFTEFLNIKGCTTGCHSNVKPPEPEKPPKPSDEELMIQTEMKPQHRAPVREPMKRPSDDEPLILLKTTVGMSLKTQLEKLCLNEEKEDNSIEGSSGSVKIGTSCNNKGCKSSYEGEHSDKENCICHPGVPVFHEGMKYWTCCQRKTSDFDAFLNQEGCETKNHNWHKPKESEEQQVRLDWHQTSGQVCLSIFSKVPLPTKTSVRANMVVCVVEITYNGGKSSYSRTFHLREPINPEKSDVKLLGTKVEVNLKKAECFSWASLEQPASTDSS